MLFVSVKDSDKPHILEPVKMLVDLGFSVIATGGTQKYLAEQGVPVERVNKVAEGRPHIVDKIVDGEIALIFNTTEGWQSHKDSQSIRASRAGDEGSLLYHRRGIGGGCAGDCLGRSERA